MFGYGYGYSLTAPVEDDNITLTVPVNASAPSYFEVFTQDVGLPAAIQLRSGASAYPRSRYYGFACPLFALKKSTPNQPTKPPF